MKKLKMSILIFIISILCFISFSEMLFSENVSTTSYIKLYFNNQLVNIGVPPIIVNNCLLVPLKDIFELLGITLSWDQQTRTVVGVKNGLTIKLRVDELTAKINNRDVLLDTMPCIEQNRVMVPTRFIAESIGLSVDWDPVSTSIYIYDPNFLKTNNIISSNFTIMNKIENIPVVKGKFFNDINLENAILAELNKTDSDVQESDFKEIYELQTDNQNIQDLGGIEKLPNLLLLSLNKNNISDLTPLKELKNLKYLLLNENKITDISPIKDLSNLELLCLNQNNIVDISSIGELVNLTEVYLASNQIIDINPLLNLKDLTTLCIEDNQIYDFNKLKMLKNLTKLQLWGLESPQDVFTQIDSIETKADEILNNLITPNMSDLDKEIAIHDYLVINTRYDIEDVQKNTIPNEAHNPFGVLINGIGVCDGFSSSMHLLLNKAGVSCKNISGEGFSFSQVESHAWNQVMIDGQYYHVDATWDDPIPDESVLGEDSNGNSNNDSNYENLKNATLDQSGISGRNTISHEYFNISDNQIMADHNWDKNRFNNICESDNNSFKENSQYPKVYLGNGCYLVINMQKMYCVNRVNGEIMKVCDDLAIFPCSDGVWIYYCSLGDSSNLYKN